MKANLSVKFGIGVLYLLAPSCCLPCLLLPLGSKLGTIVIVNTYQVRNSSTILTKEYIDALPNGWHDYAWKRINKGHRFAEVLRPWLSEWAFHLLSIFQCLRGDPINHYGYKWQVFMCGVLPERNLCGEETKLRAIEVDLLGWDFCDCAGATISAMIWLQQHVLQHHYLQGEASPGAPYHPPLQATPVQSMRNRWQLRGPAPGAFWSRD